MDKKSSAVESFITFVSEVINTKLKSNAFLLFHPLSHSCFVVLLLLYNIHMMMFLCYCFCCTHSLYMSNNGGKVWKIMMMAGIKRVW